MSPKQVTLLRFIQRQITATGAAPSYREMTVAIGLQENSIGSLTGMLDRMVDEGVIERARGQKRAIRVLRPLPDVLSAEEVGWCHDHAEAVRGLMERSG